jgi:transcriptional regulator with XRE-family HTH domain
MDPVLKQIRGQRGLSAEIARACGIERAAVYQWKKVPAKWVQHVAKVTGKRPERLRPDIFVKQR